jgi:hypothetical protein
MFRKKASKLRNDDEDLPKLERDFVSWSLKCRQKVEGRKRKFLLPMWGAIYEDPSNFLMIVSGRQVFKSTFFGDKLAHNATTIPGSTSVYVTHDDESLSSFSSDKFRQSTLEDNPVIKQFVKGSTLGRTTRVPFRNGSVVYLVTDENGFKHVEGKSPYLVILDEAQDLDLQYWPRLRESMATTQGRILLGGIGGEQGTQYYEFWKSTNQMEWIYKNESWRDKLEYNSEGLVWDDYLLDTCSGEWIASEPGDGSRHGYHLPQRMFPHIPLTNSDAIEKYRIDREFSIEFKELRYPQTMFRQHVLGEFFEGTKRPLTESMVYACMRPYQYLDLWSPQEVRDAKATFGNDIAIFLGCDFGSGNSGAAKTVVSIIIKWKERPDKGLSLPRYQLVFISDSPPQNQDDQAEWIVNLFKMYDVDFGLGDLGYGAPVIERIKKGGRNRETGISYEGVRRKFSGCWTRNDPTRAMLEKPTQADRTGVQQGYITIDKSQSIDMFIDFIQRYVNHPNRTEIWQPGEIRINNTDRKFARPQLIIPYHVERRVEFLVREFTKIERKDIGEIDVELQDPRQRAVKLYNHPPDAVMSIIYCLLADKKYDPNPYSIHRIARRRW